MTAVFDYYCMMMKERGGDTPMVCSSGPMVATCAIISEHSTPPVGDWRQWSCGGTLLVQGEKEGDVEQRQEKEVKEEE